MKKFYIKVLLKISGFGAASGLTYSDGAIRLISDDSNYLYVHQISEDRTSKILLMPGVQTEQVTKPEKLDFEAMVEKEDTVFVFGSGSEPNRELGFSISKNNQRVDTLHLGHLYSSMRSFSELDKEDFNIEGVTHTGKEWLFFNRGNGPNKRNIMYTVRGGTLIDKFELSAHDFELPKIGNMPTGFSDATMVGNKVFFLATAEGGLSTYLDGEIGGTLIGAINLQNREIEFTTLISKDQKFEGITLYRQDGDKKVSFLLCEDNDGESTESTIYQLDLVLSKAIK